MTSRVPALIDYLVNLFQNASTLGAAPAPNTVTVYDGPQTTAAPPQLVLWVGLSDPDSDAAESAATFTQGRSDLGYATRDETSEIFCAAEAWSGADDIRGMRVAAFGIVAAVETLVRADATNFGGNAALAAPGVSNGELLQNNTPGAHALVKFSITFRSFT